MNILFDRACVRIALIVWLVLSPCAATAADAADIEKQTDEISSSIMSPYCPGRLLRDCPSGQAAQLKERISERLAAGESSTQIVDSLIGTFGEEIRAAPKAEGFGAVAWMAPFFFLFVGSTLTLVWLKKRQRKDEESPPVLDHEAEARIEMELRS